MNVGKYSVSFYVVRPALYVVLRYIRSGKLAGCALQVNASPIGTGIQGHSHNNAFYSQAGSDNMLQPDNLTEPVIQKNCQRCLAYSATETTEVWL